jgi:hypothetical protein
VITGPSLFRVLPNRQLVGVMPTPNRWIWVSGVAVEGVSVPFAAASVVTVNHNLGRQPSAVSVRTSGGLVAEAQVLHVSANQLQIFFDVPLAGVVEVS